MNFFRRPLFYISIPTIALTAFVYGVFPAQSPEQGDVLYYAADSKEPIFLGGSILSEVETRPQHFGGEACQFILRVERIWRGLGDEGLPVRGKVKVKWSQPTVALNYGDTVVLEGDLDAIPGVRNPGGFDAKAYWKRQGVTATLLSKKRSRFKVLSRNQGNIIKAQAIRIKQALSRRISKDFKGQDAAFLKALFLGERSDLDDEFKDLFMRTGTIHLLAVSGFNLGFLFTVMWLLFKPIPLSRDLKLLFILMVLWGYAVLVGWQPPVVRATVMATVIIFSKIVGRRADTLNLLGLSALLILAIRPMDVGDMGFQLSFLSVLGITVLNPVFNKPPVRLPHEKWTFQEKGVRGVRDLFWISFICLFVTLPVTVQQFCVVTPWSVLANVWVVPICFLIFFAGSVYLASCFVLPSDWLMIQALKTLMSFFVTSLRFFENLPGASMIVGRLHPALWIALVTGLAYLFFTRRFKKIATRAFSILIFTTLILLTQQGVRSYRPYMSLTVLDVGQGDAIFIEFPNKGNMLLDSGRRYPDQGRHVVLPFLKFNGVRRLDALAYTHPQEDHLGGAMSILDEIPVDQILHNGRPYGSALYRDFWEKVSHLKIKDRVLNSPDTIQGSPGTSIQILYPPKDTPASRNVNEDSLVLNIEHGKNRFLLTGDIEDKGLEKLLIGEGLLKADVLKFPHHGGKVGPEGEGLLRASDPDWVVISVGAKNPFGHPHATTLSALSALPPDRVLRTDREGAVTLRSDGERIWRA